MGAPRRRYSDEERAAALAALAANNGDASATARQTGIPRVTIAHWAKGNVHPSVLKDCQQKQQDMAAKLEEVAWKLVNAIPRKIKDAPLSHTATALGICLDKIRILRSDGVIAQDAPSGLSHDERLARIAELADAARTRRAGQPATAEQPVPSPDANGQATAVP
jgi:hypothetical protein